MSALGVYGNDSDALSLAEAGMLFAGLTKAKGILLAVSGGCDSTAMMHLAAWLRVEGRLPPRLVVATLDHGLHPASPTIALGVCAAAGSLGLDSHLLRWEGAKPATGLQEAARRERYRLLDALALGIGASHLVTAHTLDDQAETIVFRMARGSGPAGLAGMRSSITRNGVVHARPFLDIAKARLMATCRASGWSFVEDPANTDPRFARARLRDLLPRLAREGLDAATLATLGRRLARDEAALRAAAETLLATASIERGAARTRLDAGTLFAGPAAIGLRALEQALTGGAQDGTPRLGRLETLYDDLADARAGGHALRRTLHGQVVALAASGHLDIRPEGPRRRGAVGQGNRAKLLPPSR